MYRSTMKFEHLRKVRRIILYVKYSHYSCKLCRATLSLNTLWFTVSWMAQAGTKFSKFSRLEELFFYILNSCHNVHRFYRGT